MAIKKILDEKLKKQFVYKAEMSDLQQKVESELLEVQKNAAIDGFRKGHVPLNIIKQKYSQSVFLDVVEKDLDSKVKDIIKENDYKMAIHPKIDIDGEVKPGEATPFKITFELMPQIPEVRFDKIEVNGFDLAFDDDDINAELSVLAKKSGTLKESEEGYSTKIGDVADINFVGTVDGVAFEGGSIDNYKIEIGSKQLIDNFEEQLVNRRKGDKFVIKVQFPDRYAHANLAGRNAEFNVTINSIHQIIPSEINDELATRVGFKDLPDLKQNIINIITNKCLSAFKGVVKEKVFNAIQDKYSFDLPETILQKEHERLAKVFSERNDSLPDKEKKKADAIEKEAKITSEKNLCLNYIIQDIISKNNIAAETKDIQDFIMQEALAYKQDPQEIVRFYESNRRARDQLAYIIEENKAFDIIFNAISVKKKRLKFKDFNKFLESV